MTTSNRLIPALAMFGLAAMAAPSHAQLFPTQTDPNVFRCESVNSREVTCRIPDGRVAVFEEQHSQSACTRGSTYWINRDSVVVTRGCRASFRLTDANVIDSPELTSELRTELAAALARRIRNDNNFSSTPTVSIVTDDQRAISSSQVGYEGTARVTRSGSVWRTVEFTSVYDLRTRELTNLDYSTAGSGTGDASERRELLRDYLDDAIEAKLDAEYPNARNNPRFELLTDQVTRIPPSQSSFSGTGRISLDGRTWIPVTFESVYDWRNDRFTSLTYQQDDGRGGSGTVMDDDAERALETALAAEIRRQLGGGNVQVVVNRRFATRGTGGRVTYTGKFGYSLNDGPWVTRGYEAILNPAGYNVRELRVFRLATR
jgi:hypothetical protein